MDSANKIGSSAHVRLFEVGQRARVESDRDAPSELWSRDELAHAAPWSMSVALESEEPGIRWCPSEAHRLRQAFAPEADTGGDVAELSAIDEALAEAYAELKAAPRGSEERAKLARQVEALRATREALRSELVDLENWSM